MDTARYQQIKSGLPIFSDCLCCLCFSIRLSIPRGEILVFFFRRVRLFVRQRDVAESAKWISIKFGRLIGLGTGIDLISKVI